jgi:hypothetical protein
MPRWHASGHVLLVVILAAACGSSGGGATQPAGPPTAQPTAATAGAGSTLAPLPTSSGGPAAGTGGTPGIDGTTGIPAIADGPYSGGSARIVITGEPNVTVEAKGAGVAMGGEAVLTYLDEAAGYSAQLTLSSRTSSGLVVSGPGLLAGGTWGKECQVTITRNEVTELAGEFACPNMQAVGSLAGKQLTITVTGTFSATR